MTQSKSMEQVAPMRFSPEENEAMAHLNTLWMQTLETHDEVLAYPENIMMEDLEDLCSNKFIHRDEFYNYEAEDGTHWLVSRHIHVEDLDAFFQTYLEDVGMGVEAA